MKSKPVIFVSYYYRPFSGVGAKRVNYWAKYLFKLSNSTFSSHVITGTKSNNHSKDEFNKVHRISAFFENPLIWSFQIIPKIIFLRFKHSNPVFIISGGPFAPFWLTYIIKALCSKVVLDFRDPYAMNPLHKVRFVKKTLKLLFEKIVTIPADNIITVNKYCRELIYCNQKKILLIDNGFNEKVLQSLKLRPTIKNTIGYAGKISIGRDLNHFLNHAKLNPNFKNCSLKYIGPDSELISGEHKSVTCFGVKSYKETLELLSSCEYLLLLYAGESFESSTKIFDYLALNKPIIVHSKNHNKKGEIVDILKNRVNSFFVDTKTIDHEKKYNKVNIDQFSRAKGLAKLINVLNKLD